MAAAAAAADTSAEAAAIARRLASCNGSTRGRAVRYLLSTFLPASAPQLSASDLLKLWKGLFFCFWHSDKPLYQSSLATRLAAGVSSGPSPASAAAFFAAYLTTLRREWVHIDIHRLDKFYLLNRRFLHHAFLLLGANSFALDITSQVISILSEKVLLPEADNVAAGSPRGLGYHVAEVFLDELLPVLPVGLLFRFSKRFSDIGAKAETVQANRKVLFGLRDAFVKVEKGLELSGLEIAVPEFESTEVPGAENGMDLDDVKVEKKKKKAKKASLVESEKEGAKASKREKKVKKEKKEKKKKKKVEVDGGDVAEHSTDAPAEEDQQMGDGTDAITFDETLMSNLQKQFEKAAAEAGMVNGGSGSSASPVSGKAAKKRKRAKSADRLSVSDGDDGSSEG
ncbi:hypothetical protein E2562_004173 [Oryza meyeriana var. granulata]|uniref:Uncharacterized protein n=1 Tax=Oryza meyeriana var. granulata TaxID=110450 RepID=A0A6G1BRR8_9ORYZ|nr:hypothetical protein E2562_004173 [Oryza meyeriana var. granulata]